jgi:hypothetical protein
MHHERVGCSGYRPFAISSYRFALGHRSSGPNLQFVELVVRGGKRESPETGLGSLFLKGEWQRPCQKR